MAEFQEVMQQLNRMCSSYPTCEGCPIAEECGNLGSYSSFQQRSKDIEKAVMGWAAEHPKLVYPTWSEWLSMKYGYDLREILYTPIHADIAEKLDIKPKEV